MPEPMVVTIDGPAGAGKSTVAKQLAQALGFEFLDTGAMYRSVTYVAMQAGIDLNDAAAVFAIAQSIDIKTDGSRVILNGVDVSQAIRTPEVSRKIAAVADNVQVRKLLSQWQRQWAQGRSVVTEGRDQGSEVFVDAACKIFLVASSHERARRRQQELASRGIGLDWQVILDQQELRDQQDRSRPVGALKKAVDAIEFSTDGLTLSEVVEQLEQIVRQKIALKKP